LLPHLHVHPELLDAIPYRTSYYKRNWGFCVTHAQIHELERSGGPFEVVIDSTLEPGSLTYGELLLPGLSDQEILLSTYICHPSLANDNLSGTVMTAFLARWLQQMGQTRYSYRIVWVPETIGAIAYCAQNQAAMQKIDMGLVITTVGGPGLFGYKQSWQADHPINKMIETVLQEAGKPYKFYPFDIHGSDERQYSSPGFRINIATICKDRYYEYPEYHTSLDNLIFVAGKSIAGTLILYKNLIGRIEARRVYRNMVGYGEVMLSRYNLYPQSGGALCPAPGEQSELDMVLWLLFFCDGRISLTEIADRLNVAPDRLEAIAV
jgi:aminopeptidase-like protein